MAVLAVPVSANDHILGDERAGVTLLEYGDYECGYCGLAYPNVLRVREHFGPRLRFVYRHFPLAQIHANAESAAEAAEFAGAHGHFWQMHDALFANQMRLGIPLYLDLARLLGLPGDELVTAISAGRYASKIQADFLGGVRSGINGTPSFFINDKRHNGGFDFMTLVAAINAQLHKVST